MWKVIETQLFEQVTRYEVTAGDGDCLPTGNAIWLLEHDAEFRRWFAELLADSPYRGYFWETPPMTLTTLTRGFEFVLVRSAGLEQLTPDPKPFSQHLTDAGELQVVSFANLRGDAQLVVPSKLAGDTSYAHLAAFVRSAPTGQVDALWRGVAVAIRTRIGPRPMWVSTAGMGVAWLHVRLDSKPKYYRYAPYRAAPE